MAAKITRSSGDVFVDLGMTAEDGREVVRRKMAERAPQPTEAQMEAASLLVVLALDKVRQKKVAGGIDLIAQALAASRDEGRREGMMRAAVIARTVEAPEDGEYWIASRIAETITTEAGEA